jgi:hypothetical protein
MEFATHFESLDIDALEGMSSESQASFFLSSAWNGASRGYTELSPWGSGVRNV